MTKNLISTDALIAAVIALLAALGSYAASSLIDPIALDEQTGDVFFGADAPRVFANMTDRHSNYFRTTVHPLLPLVMFSPVQLLRTVARLDSISAVRLYVALAAGLWSTVVFVLLRRIGCRRVDALLFTALATSSAAATFWFAVPETYAFGSLTILLALLFVSEAERRPLPTSWFVALNVGTLGVTVTNWMAGLVATLAFRPWRQMCRIAAVAFAIVLALQAFELVLFSRVRPLFYSLGQEITLYTRPPSLEGVGDAAMTFAVHAMVMPSITLVDNAKRPEWPKMRVRHGLWAWASGLGEIAAAVWTVLLTLGAWAFLSLADHRRLRFVLGGTLAGQLALHLVYGDETFLYALHWLPLLVLVAAMSTQTRARRVALLLCCSMVVLASLNNVAQLREAAAYFTTSAPERLERQHRARPSSDLRVEAIRR